MRRVIAAALLGLGLGAAAGAASRPAPQLPGESPPCPAPPNPRECRRIERAASACEAALAEADPGSRPGAAELAVDEALEDPWAAVFEACDLPGTLLGTACARAPCVAAVRPEPDASAADLQEALNACGLVDADDGDAPFAVVSWPVTCADGTEDTLVVAVQGADLTEAADALVPEEQRDGLLSAYYGIGLLGVREEELAARLACPGR